jgi:ankyrin repeat protein
MAKAVFRNAILAALLAAGLVTGLNGAPAFAQFFSSGFEFLKAVKDREGSEVTKILETTNGTVINARDRRTGESAMHIVAQRRDDLWIRFLADRGANPNIADKNGVTPLQISSNLGHFEGVEALLKAGASVDVASSTGETPLVSAVLRRDLAMVRLLLANGANPDRADNSGRSARAYAKLSGGERLLDEIKRSDEDRKDKKPADSYGPSF